MISSSVKSRTYRQPSGRPSEWNRARSCARQLLPSRMLQHGERGFHLLAADGILPVHQVSFFHPLLGALVLLPRRLDIHVLSPSRITFAVASMARASALSDIVAGILVVARPLPVRLILDLVRVRCRIVMRSDLRCFSSTTGSHLLRGQETWGETDLPHLSPV